MWIFNSNRKWEIKTVLCRRKIYCRWNKWRTFDHLHGEGNNSATTDNMISKEELKEKTGYDSFLQFKRNCYSSAVALHDPKLTTYYYDKVKEVDLYWTPGALYGCRAGKRKTKAHFHRRRECKTIRHIEFKFKFNLGLQIGNWI